MRSPDRRASDANRGWSAGTASFLDRLDLEVRVVTAGGVGKRSLRRQTGLAPVLAHDVALLEWMRRGRDLRGIRPVPVFVMVQDIAQLVTIASVLLRRTPQPCQA